MTTIYSGIRLTVDEFLALPEMDKRCELIDGVLYMAAFPIPDHQFLATILSSTLVQQIIDTGLGIVLQPTGVLLSQNTVVGPDITVIRSERTDIIGSRVIDGAPDIVVEVLSSDRNHDLVVKRRHYEQVGVAEYWVIDGVADTLTVLELVNGAYRERAVLTSGDTLTTPLFPAFSLPLGELFNHPARIRR